MRTLALLTLLACGAPALELETVGGAAPATTAAVDAGELPPAPWCHCCWPVRYHGPNRCRFARAVTAPPDVCESDPEQRCGVPTKP